MAQSSVDPLLKSNKGHNIFEHEGYIYTFDRKSKDGLKNFWRCQKKNADPPCLGRIHTDASTGEVLKIVQEHLHGESIEAVEVTRVRNAIKEKAICSKGGPSTIINLAIQNVEPAVLASLPPRESLRHMVQNVRKREMAHPTNPVSLSDLVIPDAYRTYSVSDLETVPFLLYDSGPDDEHRILIFGNSSNGAWIKNVKQLYGDGTFKVAPVLFKQVFELLGKRNDYVLPLLYCLLPNKTQAAYLKMFDAIHRMWPELNPDHYSSDFEVAGINAFKAVFPSCRVHGCFFHLKRNVKSKLEEIGLKKLYTSSAEFSMQAKMIASLAFVPPVDLEAALDAIRFDLSPDILPLLRWFSRVYIGVSESGLRKPIFPPSLWSVYERTLTGLDRTNNYVEAAHRCLRSHLGFEHSSIWQFIDGLREFQKGRDLLYQQYVRGDPAQDKRKKYKDSDKKLKKIAKEYNDRTFQEYLRGAAANLALD